MVALTDYASDERTARVVLSMMIEPADRTVGRLLLREGAVETLRLLDAGGSIPGVRAEEAAILHHTAQQFASRGSLGEELARVLDGSYAPLIPGDAHWPVSVDALGDRAPYVLWSKGATSFLANGQEDRVTITGSRVSTSYGDHVAGELARDASHAEQIVVSGGAYGIDGAAHRSALSSVGQTIAVMPGGLDRLYPAGHRDMLEQVGSVGLLMSEMPPGSAPTRAASHSSATPHCQPVRACRDAPPGRAGPSRRASPRSSARRCSGRCGGRHRRCRRHRRRPRSAPRATHRGRARRPRDRRSSSIPETR